MYCSRADGPIIKYFWFAHDIPHFGAHDLRHTTYAKLCRKSCGDLEQIKFLLGHRSIQTTESYLGSEQETTFHDLDLARTVRASQGP
jgi:integrase